MINLFLKDDTNTISGLSNDETSSNTTEGNILANDSDADSTLAVVGISNTNNSDVRILSKGFEDNLDDNPEVYGEFGSLAGVTVDGEHYRTIRGTGITVLGSDGQVLSHETFDTHGDTDASNNLVTHLSEIDNTASDGVSIIITTNDAWTANLSDEAKNALENIGGTESILNDAGHRSSYVLVSEKSDGEWNTTQEEYQPKAADEPLLFRVQENGTVYSPEESPVDGSTTLEGAVGTVTINPDGTYSYELDDSNSDVQELQDGESLTETFTIQVQDEPGHTTTETLTITVTGANDDTAPVLFTDQNDTISLSTDDPEYQTGRTYNALDGNNHITGGEGDDTIFGGAGNDTIFGEGGNDIIDGGKGTDSVYYSGNIADYAINQNDDNSFTIADSVEDRDGTDTVVNVESFEFADGTVSSANLIDGAVEGLEYTTTSGLNGYTNKDGGFLFAEGDEVTFNVGGVVLGVATAEDVKSGQTFLQDIADVDRTDLNDEYLENMATFLQSLDENNDAYDGIVITDEIREALADSTIDLRTASEEDVQQLVEQVGKSYVSEDDAMDHVEDMLVEHTDLDHNEFEEHINDDLTDTDQAIRSDQKKESLVTAASTTGFDTAEADSATEEVRVSEVNDLSLNIPSLELPNEEQSETLNVETEETAPAKQEALSQEKITVPDSSNDSTVLSTDVLADDDLSHALPAESLSNLFDETTEDVEVTPSATENNSKDDTRQQQTETTQAEESVVETKAVSRNTAPAAMDERVAEEADSSEIESESISTNTAEDTEQLETVNESPLNTDDLHINLDGESEANPSESSASEQEPQTEESDNSLDRFSANSSNSDNNEGAPLDEFSATSSTDDDKEMEALDTIDDTANNMDLDQPEDAGLSDADAIIEDIPQEVEQVDASCAG